MFQNFRIRRLIKKLGSSEQKASKAQIALKNIGAPAVGALRQALLTDPDWSVRRAAAEVLGGIGDPNAVDALIPSLRSSDIGTRWRSAAALGEIGDSRAVPALSKALLDNDGMVVRQATQSLAKIADDRATDALISALAIKEAQSTAADELARLNQPRIIELLNKVIAGPASSAQAYALRVLAGYNIPDSSKYRPRVFLPKYDAVPTLIAALKHKNAELRRESASLLADLRLNEAQIAQAAAALAGSLEDKDDSVSAAAVATLSKFGRLADPALTGRLTPLVREDYPAAQRAFDALTTILQSSSGKVSATDLKAIAKLKEITIVVGTYEAACTPWHPVISDEPIYGPMGVSALVQAARQELIRRGKKA